MREIALDAAPEVVLSRLRVLAIRLKARPDTATLAGEVDGARTELKTRLDQYEEKHDERLAATGAVVFADDEEDAAIAGLARRVRVLVEGKRDDPRYLRLFQKAPSTLTEGVADEQQKLFAEHLIATLAAHADYVSLRDLLPELEGARQGVEVAQANQAELMRLDEAAWNEVQIAEQKAREVYRDAKPKLELMFPGRKKLVDSFFYQTPKKKKKE
jgi:hypothetical protein